jgi:photosystem II stability/assembly factor-like uncharacterized protein
LEAKVKRLVLFAVCAIAATAAAAQWHYLSGGRLSGISSVGSYVWAVGQDGLFFYSEDNGEYWRRVPRFTTRNLVDVEFWDEGFRLVTAEGDILYRTTDNGATWDSSYVQYIGGHIRFITRDCIWVTSSSGTRIRRSTDGGLSWPLGGPSWYSSWFIDSLNGWSSYGTYVFRTSDAGQRGQQSWQQVGELPVPMANGGIYCFGFRDSLNGVCAWHSSYWSPHNTVYAYGWSVTTDGGVSWDYLTQAATPGVVCDIGPDGRVYGTEEQGCIVYEPTVYHRSGMSKFQEFRDVSAARGNPAWVCGGGAATWSSADSGLSWAPAKPQSGASLRNVDFSDSLHGWGTSPDWAARTTDGGRAWIRAPAKPGVSTISDVVAISESVCLTAAGWSRYDFLYGYDGAFGLERSVNAGVSWDTIQYLEFYFGDAPIGSSRFSHVGEHIWHPGVRAPNGNSLRSTDDGATWLDMDTIGTIGDGEPSDISFVDTLHGWVIGSRRNIRSTTDGGDSWTILATGLNVKRLKMTSLSTGWAISDSELFQTTDGGVTWDGGVIHSGLQAIAFCDSSHGAIVGLNGLILHTDDAGQTWQRDSSEFTSDIYDVFMLDSTHAWAVGENGLVLGFGDWAIGIAEARGRESPRTLASGVSVRPNPCRAHATIELSRPIVRPMQVTLVDIAGRVTQAVPAHAGARVLKLDLRGTPGGVYFIRAGAGAAARLVVQR